jgi:hypothetical protein
MKTKTILSLFISIFTLTLYAQDDINFYGYVCNNDTLDAIEISCAQIIYMHPGDTIYLQFPEEYYCYYRQNAAYTGGYAVLDSLGLFEIRQVTEQGQYYFGDLTNPEYCYIHCFIRWFEESFFDIGDYVFDSDMEPILLKAPVYGINNSFLWANGSTDSLIYIETPGEYWIELTDQCNLIHSDTITVYPPDSDSCLFYAGKINNNYVLTNYYPEIEITDIYHSGSNSNYDLDINEDGISDYNFRTQGSYANGGGFGWIWITCYNDNEIASHGAFLAGVINKNQVVDSSLNWVSDSVFLRVWGYQGCPHGTISSFDQPFWNNSAYGYLGLRLKNDSSYTNAYIQLRAYDTINDIIFKYTIKDYAWFDYTQQNIYKQSIAKQTTIYPNPISNYVTVQLQKQIGWVSAEIYTIRGDLIQVSTLFETETQIDFSGLSSGLYLLKLISNDWTEIHRIIKW